MPKIMTKDGFIEKARTVHGDKYDYSKVEYVNSHTKICIICPIHGEFWQTPNSHLNGNGCSKCGNSKKGQSISITKDEFLKRALRKFGDKYDYSIMEYNNFSSKINIICPIHGIIEITPKKHLECCGCDLCSKTRIKSTEEFIRRANNAHHEIYDYSKSEYKSAHEKICIICPIHGEFWQTPAAHIGGHRCPKCYGKHGMMNNENFINLSKKVHNYQYSYEKTNFINLDSKVIITCKIHGDFLQSPNKHLYAIQGCPKCKSSQLETKINRILSDCKIEYEYQKKFDWLGKQSLDFYIPKYNIAIECQGIQHFKPIYLFGGEEQFKANIVRDTIKKNLCNKNGIKLLYYTNLKDYETFLDEPLIKSEEELINKITEKEK